MIVYDDLTQFQTLRNAVVTSGTFDGVHIGHQKILERISQIARKNNGESVILTFWPHPRLVLYPNQADLKLLSTFEEKAELLEAQGIDHLVKIAFTPEFAQLSSQQFIEQILIDRIGTKRLVIGYDHRFGRNREGSFEHLKRNSERYGFVLEEIPRQDIENIGVSSTKVREALTDGDVQKANSFLGRHYSIKGQVVDGDKIGREMGFPTANLAINEKHKLIPADGIYAVKVQVGDKPYQGMLYIGNRPTLEKSEKVIEVNIFDFNEEIYGEHLKVDFVTQIRNDSKFETIDELKAQLEKDKIDALNYLS